MGFNVFRFFLKLKYPALSRFIDLAALYVRTATPERPAFELFNEIAYEFCSLHRKDPHYIKPQSDEEIEDGIVVLLLTKIYKKDIRHAVYTLALIEERQFRSGIPLPGWFQGMGGVGYSKFVQGLISRAREELKSIREEPETPP